mgnify:FL=1
MKKTKILLPIMLFALCSCGETTDSKGKAMEYSEGVKLLQNCVSNVDTYDAIGFNANLEKYDLHVFTDSYHADVDTHEKSGESTITDVVQASVSGEFDVAVSGLTSATAFNELKASVKANLNADVKSEGQSVFGDNKEPVAISAQLVLDEGNGYVDVNKQLKDLISANAGVEIPEKFYAPVVFDESNITFPLFNNDLIENGIETTKAQIEALIKENAEGLTDEQVSKLIETVKNTLSSFVSFKVYQGGKYEVSVELNKTNLTLAVNTIATSIAKAAMGDNASNLTDEQLAEMVKGMTESITSNFDGINHINLSAMFSEKAFLSAKADVDVKVKTSSRQSTSPDETNSISVVDTYIDMKLKSSTTLSFGEDVKVLTIANKEEYTLVNLGGSGDNK